MLTLIIPLSPEGWDPLKEEFVEPSTKTIQLEHSLVSISKWESKWHKSFLSTNDKTYEEIMDYIKCMTVTQNVDPDVYLHLTKENVDRIQAYIEDPMTATHFSSTSGGNSREKITSELIYYWMINLGIPVEFQKWHLNRLLTLIRVCEVKNSPPKKRGKGDIMREYANLNAARRQQLNSKG